MPRAKAIKRGRILLVLDPDLHARLARLADRDRTTVTALLRAAAERVVEAEERSPGEAAPFPPLSESNLYL